MHFNEIKKTSKASLLTEKETNQRVDNWKGIYDKCLADLSSQFILFIF